MNFSVHVIAMNLLFYFTGGFTLIWNLVLGINAFGLVLWYLSQVMVPKMSQSNFTAKIQEFSAWVNQTQIALQLQASCEIMMLFPMGVRGMVMALLRFYGYLFGYELYRYATDPTHKRIWAGYREKYTGLVNKLPAAIAGLLLKIPESAASTGALGMQIYSGVAT
jgi:hypothetical protein